MKTFSELLQAYFTERLMEECKACVVAYEWVSGLSFAQGTFEDSFHTRREVSLFGRGLLLLAVGGDSLDRTC